MNIFSASVGLQPRSGPPSPRRSDIPGFCRPFSSPPDQAFRIKHQAVHIKDYAVRFHNRAISFSQSPGQASRCAIACGSSSKETILDIIFAAGTQPVEISPAASANSSVVPVREPTICNSFLVITAVGSSHRPVGPSGERHSACRRGIVQGVSDCGGGTRHLGYTPRHPPAGNFPNIARCIFGPRIYRIFDSKSLVQAPDADPRYSAIIGIPPVSQRRHSGQHAGIALAPIITICSPFFSFRL